jgi:hypothetical protein
MTEPMTEPTVVVLPEPDPTPLVRLLTRTVRTSLRQRPDQQPTPLAPGVVVVRSASDAQVATVIVGEELIRIASGADPSARAVLTVDLGSRLEVVGTDGEDAVVASLAGLLRPTLPDWQDAAHGFWSATGSDAGMPATLVVESSEPDGEVLELGAGSPRYVVHGSADQLAGLFTGADSFLEQVFGGRLKVRGTLPQLSVMAGASHKVRFHV